MFFTSGCSVSSDVVWLMLHWKGRNHYYNVKDYSFCQEKSYISAQNFQSCSEAQCLLYPLQKRKCFLRNRREFQTHWIQWENWASSPLMIMSLVVCLKYSTGSGMPLVSIPRMEIIRFGDNKQRGENLLLGEARNCAWEYFKLSQHL